MSILRERLKTSCPELWQALENSWRIAIRTWLPMVDIRSQVENNQNQIEKHFKDDFVIDKARLLKIINQPIESFNSLPHLINLENHLDKIVLDIEKYYQEQNSRNSFELTPIEIYVICSAILFHDMGRIEKGENHGGESKKKLKEIWAELGVYSEELAIIIGTICAFHTDENWMPLTVTVANQFGTVRANELACLLVLIDEMDDSYTRVYPDFMHENWPSDFKATLRRPIQEVYFDPQKKTVFTVLSKLEQGGEDKPLIKYEYAMVLLEKKQKLLHIQQPLSRLGIYIQGWRLECKEQLIDIIKVSYEKEGQRFLLNIKDELRTAKLKNIKITDITIVNSFEACFHIQYLETMVKRMWDLSTQIFGATALTYENLASAMSETNVGKVRMAVNRLAILSKYVNGTDINKDMEIQVGQKQWKWPVKPGKKGECSDSDRYCLYIHPDRLIRTFSAESGIVISPRK